MDVKVLGCNAILLAFFTINDHLLIFARQLVFVDNDDNSSYPGGEHWQEFNPW